MAAPEWAASEQDRRLWHSCAKSLWPTCAESLFIASVPLGGCSARGGGKLYAASAWALAAT